MTRGVVNKKTADKKMKNQVLTHSFGSVGGNDYLCTKST